MFTNKIQEFLKQDGMGMQEANFSTTRYIAQLLIQKRNVQQVYQEMTEKENQCEDIISQIIDEKYTQFNPMIDKPNLYGKAYDRLSQSVKQNRRRLAKSKELLSSRSINLQQSYYQTLFTKEIIQALQKIKQLRQSITLIQTQAISQPYEACIECKKIKNQLQMKDSIHNQYLNKGYTLGVSQILGEFQCQLREFFFGARSPPLLENSAQKYFDAEKKVTNLRSTLEVLQFIKLNVPDLILPRDEELGLCLLNSKLDNNEEIKISYDQLKKFIGMSFQFNDFDQVKQYLENNTNSNGDLIISLKQQNGLLNIFLCVKGCIMIKKTNELLNNHFQDFKFNTQDLFTKCVTMFIRKCNPNEQYKFSLFGELNFSSFTNYRDVGEFFKKLIAHAMILLRKQVLFGKILHYLKVDVDENTLLLSLSELCRQLFWQINVTLSMFYKKEQNRAREQLDVRNEYHLFIQSALQQLIKPSPLYYLLQKDLLEEVLQSCIESLKTFMRIEPIFKEPIDNEVILQQELNKSIYQNCVKQLTDGVKQVMRNIIQDRKKINKQFQPQINYEFNPEIQDPLLKQMLNQFKYSDIKMKIPESIQTCYLIHELNVINKVTNLKLDYLQILNWILNVYIQETKAKIKSLIQGSQSEIFLYNLEKQNLQKKLFSYLEWKCKFQQSNIILNDGINTQSRLDKAKSDKKFRNQLKEPIYSGYKEYLINDQQQLSNPLIKSKEILHNIASLHENIFSLLNFIKQSLETFLDQIDTQQLIRELDIQQKDQQIDAKDNKLQIIKMFQIRCAQQTFQISSLKNKNAFDISLDDNFRQAIYRLLLLNEEIFNIQYELYLILRFELHLRCLLITNIQDFHYDYLNFEFSLKESLSEESLQIILNDFWTMFKTSLKAQFIREQNFNQKKIQMILKDLNVFKEQDAKYSTKVSHLRRYFKLYLINGQDIEKFLKINQYKYKYNQIQEYCNIMKINVSIENLSKYCK